MKSAGTTGVHRENDAARRSVSRPDTRSLLELLRSIELGVDHIEVVLPPGTVAFGRLGLEVRPVLINGAAGWVSVREGEVYAVAAATVQGDLITALHILIDPVRLFRLNLRAVDL